MSGFSLDEVKTIVAECGGNSNYVDIYLLSLVDKDADKYKQFINTPSTLLEHSNWIIDGSKMPNYRKLIERRWEHPRYSTVDLQDELQCILDEYRDDGGNFENAEWKAIADEIVASGIGSFVMDW